MKRSYVRIFDVDIRNSAVQESTEDTRIAMSCRSIFNLDQFPVCASRFLQSNRLLNLLGPVEVLLYLGCKVPLVAFLRLCIVLLLSLQLLDKRSNDKADIVIFFIQCRARSRGFASGIPFTASRSIRTPSWYSTSAIVYCSFVSNSTARFRTAAAESIVLRARRPATLRRAVTLPQVKIRDCK